MNATPLLSIATNNAATKSPVLGFVGVGWIGRNRLAAAIATGANIAAIADSSSESLNDVKLLAPHAVSFSSFEELLPLSLDGIVIATPNALHAPQTIEALENGFAVFCQKPLGRNGDEAKRIIQTARRHDCLLGVDLSYRHIHGLKQIRELIKEEALGDIFSADLVFHNAYGPDKQCLYDQELSSGGCVMDLGTHLIDAILWCLDTSVQQVSSRLFSQGRPYQPRHHTVEDYATMRIDLESGAIANVACSWKLHAGQNTVIEFTFYGTRGGVTLRNVAGSYTEFIAERFQGTSRWTLSESNETWQGGAIQDWIQTLSKSSAYDYRIKYQIELAETIDAVYKANASHTNVTI